MIGWKYILPKKKKRWRDGGEEVKFLSEDQTIEYKGYSINSRLDGDSVRELISSLIEARRLFYAEDPRAMAMQDPFEVEVKGERFMVIISSKFIRLQQLKTD